MQDRSVVLLSIHPEHAEKILSGEKKLEFRRRWTSHPVHELIIYVTAPIKRIVAIAKIKEVHQGSSTALWALAQQKGGGLSRQALYTYFSGLKTGYAIELESVERFPRLLDSSLFIKGFRAPQSFSYVDSDLYRRLRREFGKKSHRNDGKVIFVGGVHGVGKTTLCSQYALAHNLTTKSASQLIREAKQAAISASGKAVKNIAGNQKLLINAVRQYRSAGKNLLLDGHFALWDENHQVTPLEADVFSDLGIDGIVVLHDSPTHISKRLESRDSNRISPSSIAEIQRAELVNAVKVSNELSIPVAQVRSGDRIRFNQLVDILF